jgi:tetratricopeptide (TPR) repeat protein
MAFRKTDYDSSMMYSLKALSIDTYNADANIIYGLSAMILGDTTSAIDGFSIASQDISQRTAAYNGLSSIFMKKGDFNKALSYAEKSLLFNQMGSDGIQLKILSLRKLGRLNEASGELSQLEKTDPLNHFIRFERYIVNPSPENKTLVQKFITNEFPHETYLEYAIWYFNNGQLSDACRKGTGCFDDAVRGA